MVTDCVGGSSLARHTASLDAMEYLQSGSNRTSAEVIAAFEELALPRTSDLSVPTLVEA